tara:strand:+ start:924 stop:1145 length:222 start_codon:yes stop_codon:yes gene_type:complete
MAMVFITSIKKISTRSPETIGHNRYQPIWEMMYKLSSVMRLRDKQNSLKNELESDKGFFETVNTNRGYIKKSK